MPPSAGFLGSGNRSTSGLADPPGLPWLYPYLEDADSTRLGLPVFRPYVPISMVGPAGSSPIYGGLIGTGCDAILVSDLVADYLGVDLEDAAGETTHAVAGPRMHAPYQTGSLRHHRPAPPRDSSLAGRGLVVAAAA